MMEIASWQFGLLPLFSTLSLPKPNHDDAAERALLELLSSRINALPEGLTLDLEFYQLQATKGEAFQLIMPSVLSFKIPNSSNVGSSDSVVSGLQHGVFPYEDFTVATEDNRQALFLSVQLNQLAFMAETQIENGRVVPTTQDVYIHVFLNGSLCTSRFVPRKTLVGDPACPHFEGFHGENIGNNMERAWIIGVNSTNMKNGNESKDISLGSGSAARWKAINEKLRESVSSQSNASSVVQYLSKYVSALADLPLPRQGLSELNSTFAVIDVVVVGGLALGISKIQHHSDREFSAPEQYRQTYSRPILHDTSPNVNHQIGVLQTPQLQETTIEITTGNQTALVGPFSVSTLQENTQFKRMRSGSFHSDGLYGDSSDDAQETRKGKAATKLRSSAYLEPKGSKNYNQEPQATLRQLSTRFEVQHSDDENRDAPSAPVLDERTGHISNIAALRISQNRSVRTIAQFPKPNRKWRKRHQVVASDTSIASLHRSSPNRSLNSVQARSVVWSSTSSEVRRLRAAKADLSLPRKKRRRQRYQSADFDSEDPVAAISGTLEARIRIVPRNEKPILPLQKADEQQNFKGPASKLVKPIIHRNLRRKRERQIVKRNPEVGLTERDVYNWIKADYDIRGGAKPWLEQQENVEIPLAQSLSDMVYQETVDGPATQLGSGFEQFQHEMQKEFDREYGLMKGSVITVENDITRSCPGGAVVDFKSENIVQGARFIFV